MSYDLMVFEPTKAPRDKAAFAWSASGEAYAAVRMLALKHKVGFFDVSGSDGEIVFP